MTKEIMRTRNVPAVLFIIFLTFLTWYRVLGQSLMGEGFFYFRNGFGSTSFGNFVWEFISSYDAGAKLLFVFFKFIFREQLPFYQLFLLVSTILTNILFYFMVVTLTRQSVVALIAAILFTVNYNGFEMLAVGNYQWFVQRALSLPFLFLSFTFFVHFLHEEKDTKRVYFISLVFYILAFVLFHFSLFFAIFFGTYFLTFFWKKRSTMSFLRRKVFLLIPFILIPYVLLTQGKGTGLIRGLSLSLFWQQHTSEILPQILQQYLLLVIPEGAMSFVASAQHVSKWLVLQIFQLPVIGLTLFSLWILWKKGGQMSNVALACLLYLPLALFLNLYLRWELTYNLEGGSRYLYVPSAVSSIFLAVVFWNFLFRFENFRRMIALLFLVFWVAFNLWSVVREINIHQYQHEASKKTLAYVKKLKNRFSEDSIVILPNIIGYHGSDFVQLFYGKSRTYILPKFALGVGPLPRAFDPDRDFIIDYDFEAKVAKDLTNSYQSIFFE